MLHVILGGSPEERSLALEQLMQKLSATYPNNEVIRWNADQFVSESVTALIPAEGLFAEVYCVILDQIALKEEGKMFHVEFAHALHASTNIFVILERSVPAPVTSSWKKAGIDPQKISLPVSQKPDLTIFDLGDAIGARDRKLLWTKYETVRRKGSAPEEIHGTLFWALKGLLVAKQVKNEEEAGSCGIKPYSYKKFLTGSRKFSFVELEEYSWQLIELYTRAREPGGDLSIALEEWVLNFR